MEKIKNGFRRFIQDLSTPRHFLFKMIFFTLLAGMVLLWPQFTVHQEALGLTVAQTGTFTAVMSGVSIVVPFVSGMLGDKMGNYRIFLVISTLLAAVPAFLFSVVPSAKIPNTSNTTTSNTTIEFSTTTEITNTTYASVASSTDATSTKSSPAYVVDEDFLPVTFWTYLIVRVAYGVLHAVSFTLFEAAVLAEGQATGLDFGFQRAWGTLAVLISSFLSGFLVQQTGGFNILFYLAAALQVVTAVLMLFLRLDFKPPAMALTRNILRHAANAEVLMFFVAILLAGFFFGYLETFMYRYLFGLGATHMMIGLTVTVGAPFEIILTLLASFLVPLVGHAPIIIFGLFAHSVRLLGFGLLENPWWVMPLEVLESVSNGLLWTVGAMYCAVLFPLESIASFRGISAVIYFGIGQLIASASGASLQNALTEKGAFQALAAFALVCALAYAAAYYALRRCGRNKEAAEVSTGHDVENKLPSNLGPKNEGFDNKAWVPDE